MAMGVLVSLAAAAVAALGLGHSGAATSAPTRVRASLAATSVPMPSSTARRRRPAALLRELKVCGKAAYNARAYRCVRDERSHPLVSTAVYCSVTIYAYAAVTVRGKMTYGGEVLFTHTGKVKARTIFHLALVYDLPVTLPGGRYGCTFSAAGKTVKASMSGGGAPGPVSASSVCTSSHTNPDFKTCTSDESAQPLAPTTSLTCSGVFVGKKGRFGGIELLYNDNGVWTSLEHVEGTLKNPLVAGFLTVPGLLGQPFVPGQYSCRFTVDGQAVAEKLFSFRA
jgi:hypothetical protein